MTPAHLRDRLTATVQCHAQAVVDRFLPDLRWPAYCAGFVANRNDAAELAWVLSFLHRLGVRTFAGRPIPQAITALVRQVSGETMETFHSYRLAETLLAFGAFDGNPLLADLSAAERANLADAVDSSHIYDQWGKPLGGRPNNYWGVLARCEHARQRLGLLPNTRLLDESVGHVRRILFHNPLGFFDDSPALTGRFDIYTADVLLFLEPLWPLLDGPAASLPDPAADLAARPRLRHIVAQHVHLLETMALEHGVSFAWGRSIGALSVCLTAELAALALRSGVGSDRRRLLGLAAAAADAFDAWMADDLIAAHRHRMTDGYRGPVRLLQMTLDQLGKLAWTAETLGQVAWPAPAPADDEPVELFPPTDTLIALDPQGAAVWCFRNRHLVFQLPLVDRPTADYVPWPRCPGLLENPVDSPLLCGVPRVLVGGAEYTSSGRPAAVEKLPNGLRVVYDGWTAVDGKTEPQTPPGRRSVCFSVADDTLHVDEDWTFANVPTALELDIPHTRRPLHIEVSGEAAFRRDRVAVDGMSAWRSAWSELVAVDQVHVEPAERVRLRWSLTPQRRVLVVPRPHDYVRSLFEALEPGWVVEQGYNNGLPPEMMNVERLLGASDIFHLHWPEHLFATGGQDAGRFREAYLAFIAAVGRSRCRVVWTMHNRRPHYLSAEQWTPIYHAWARVADGVIHHSRWGEQVMRRELPFRPDARHVVIPHGHFGARMPRTASRTELEARLGLKPAAIRFGVLGRAQKDKRVDVIVRAFHAAGRPDQQLLVDALTPDEAAALPADERIVIVPRGNWLERDEIARRNQVCDALVVAHDGPTYLTSGLSADAIGLGLAMLVPPWAFFAETLGSAALVHDNTEAGLTRRFAEVTAGQIAASQAAMTALQPAHDWSRLARLTLDLYRSL